MRYSLHDRQYRFKEWTQGHFEISKVFELIKDLELYDLVNDPLETKNIAASPEMAEVFKDLSNKLHAFYQKQYLKINSHLGD